METKSEIRNMDQRQSELNQEKRQLYQKIHEKDQAIRELEQEKQKLNKGLTKDSGLVSVSEITANCPPVLQG